MDKKLYLNCRISITGELITVWNPLANDPFWELFGVIGSPLCFSGSWPLIKELLTDMLTTLRSIAGDGGGVAGCGILYMEAFSSPSPSSWSLTFWWEVVVVSETFEEGLKGRKRPPKKTFRTTIAPVTRNAPCHWKLSINLKRYSQINLQWIQYCLI